MDQKQTITCLDHLSNQHEVPKDEIVQRTSVYGVTIDQGRVLLIKDKLTKMWELPGGGLEIGEDEKAGLKREFFEETGLRINGEVVLIHSAKNYFYALDVKEGRESLRHFYLIRSVDQGQVLTQGNGTDTLAAQYFQVDEIMRFPKELMQPIYKNVLNIALTL